MVEILIIAAMTTSPVQGGQQDGDHTQRVYVCRANEEFFEQGSRICLDLSGTPRTAVCGTVLNNSAWRFLDETCTPDQPSPPVANPSDDVE